jgi:hypothetical protein
VIHAARRRSADLDELCRAEPLRSALLSLGWGDIEETIRRLPRGAYVGQVELLHCEEVEGLVVGPVERAFGNYSAGRYAWITGRAWRAEPALPGRGMQRLWTVPAGTWAELGPRLRAVS